VIGAAPTNDVVITEPTISRRHVELSLVPEGVSVRDLGSRNGTFYMGQRLQSMVLGLGARIRIGTADIALDADTDALAEGKIHDKDSYRGIVGSSLAMRRLFASLVRLEGSLVGVLVEGESGVGKELIARALHEGSPVAGGPLVTVNCGAIPRELVASELFGPKRGAFTGAVEARRGAFENADGGTLFLDEIGELPLEVQPMLLRALETGDIQPVGGERPHQVRVRIVAATHRNLEEEATSGAFRHDLYYRLAVVKLRVPPLRERTDDIEPLALRFATAAGLQELPASILERLKGRTWPGNARELRNAVQAYAALGVLPEPSGSRGGILDLCLADFVDAKRPYGELKEELGDRFMRVYLQALMKEVSGNQTAAARLAGLDRTYLGRLLVKHGLLKG
jgi:transcriptional regulator with GAF, ATPase, and Fis domain